MKHKIVKIDWDTVELVVEPVRQFPDRRGRSIVKKILSGASAKARAQGAVYTHSQLRSFIPAGLEMLIYGWWLLAAAIASSHDLSRGVKLAASAIIETSQRVAQSVVRY